MRQTQAQQQAILIPPESDWIDIGNRLLDSAAFLLASIAILTNEDGCDDFDKLSKSWFFYTSFSILIGSALLRSSTHYRRIKNIWDHGERPTISDWFYAGTVPFVVFALAIAGLITTRYPNNNSCFYVSYVSLLGPFSSSVLGDVAERNISEYSYSEIPREQTPIRELTFEGLQASMVDTLRQALEPILNSINQAAVRSDSNQMTIEQIQSALISTLRGVYVSAQSAANQAVATNRQPAIVQPQGLATNILLHAFQTIQNIINQAIANGASNQAILEQIQNFLASTLVQAFLLVNNEIDSSTTADHTNQLTIAHMQQSMRDASMQLMGVALVSANNPPAAEAPPNSLHASRTSPGGP